jgi:hypothetical protein
VYLQPGESDATTGRPYVDNVHFCILERAELIDLPDTDSIR